MGIEENSGTFVLGSSVLLEGEQQPPRNSSCGRGSLRSPLLSHVYVLQVASFLLHSFPPPPLSCSRSLSSSVKFRTASRFHRKKRSVVTVARVLNYANSYVGEIVARSTVYRDKKTRVSSQIPPLVSRANRICPRPCFFSCVHRNRRVQGSVGSIICQLVPRFNAYFDELDV